MNRLPLPLVVAGTAVVAAAYLAALLPGPPPEASAYGLAAGTGALLAGLLMMGARRHGHLSAGMGALFLTVGLWVAGGLSILLALPGIDAPDAPLVLGLPRRAAFLLLGVGLAPGLVVPVAYGLVFDRDTLSEADLERLHRVAEEVRREQEGE